MVAASKAGADEVDAVEAGLGRDPVLPAAPGDAVVGHVGLKVLPALPAVHVPAPQSARAHRRRDCRQRLLRGSEQVPAPAGQFPFQSGGQADHQPLAGKFRARDLRHGIGDQRSVRALPQQPADVLRLQGRDPVEPRWPGILADPRRG